LHPQGTLALGGWEGERAGATLTKGAAGVKDVPIFGAIDRLSVIRPRVRAFAVSAPWASCGPNVATIPTNVCPEGSSHAESPDHSILSR
ncbi:MAG: hypothetical protein ACR2RE_26080, partial [Geminicoccaceae bacterium]